MYSAPLAGSCSRDHRENPPARLSTPCHHQQTQTKIHKHAHKRLTSSQDQRWTGPPGRAAAGARRRTACRGARRSRTGAAPAPWHSRADPTATATAAKRTRAAAAAAAVTILLQRLSAPGTPRRSRARCSAATPRKSPFAAWHRAIDARGLDIAAGRFGRVGEEGGKRQDHVREARMHAETASRSCIGAEENKHSLRYRSQARRDSWTKTGLKW